jgi:3-dehydroquinate dehydratase-2
MKLLILNGPNLNLLGRREPEIYGSQTYDDLCRMIEDHANHLGIEVEIFQSNHEGDLVDRIQAAYGAIDGLILNPAAYTHTSIALLDALLAVQIPAVEVHISQVDDREPFRRISYIRQACLATISGHGFAGYLEAMDLLVNSEVQS